MWGTIIQDILTFSGKILVIVLSGIVAYYQINKNNLKQKKKELILNYLIDSFRKLALAVQRPPAPNSPYFRDMESAVADIQLFGTKSQIESLTKCLKEWEEKNQADFNDLLDKLRKELRKELELTDIKESIRWFRPEGAPQKTESL